MSFAARPLCLVLALLISAGVPGAFAQTPATSSRTGPDASAPTAPDESAQDGVPPDRAPVPSQSVPSLPVDMEHIKQEAGKQPVMKLDQAQLRFYVLITATPPKVTFKDIAGNYDLMNGPTKGGAAMTHQEFLNMVTPRELNELFGATSSSSFAMFQAALMNAAGQMIIKKALDQIRHARNDQEVAEIRARIDAELRHLNGQDR